MASRSAWTARAGAWTTSSSSGCGAVSNTRRSTSTLMRLWPKPRLALVAGWTFTTRSVSIRAWVISHTASDLPGRPVDMWTIGVADRLRFSRFPSELGSRGNAHLRPHPHRHYSQQSASYWRFEKQRRCTSHCTDNDRSRHQNRQGYTLRNGSGCLTNGVHLKWGVVGVAKLLDKNGGLIVR